MNRILLALSALTLSSVFAQTARPPLPQPTTVSFDGKTLRALTYQGQRYVSADDLRAAGLNGGPQNFYLFTAPRANVPPYKTTGCLGELLFNGAAYLRAKPLVQDNVNAQTLWRINFAFQPQLAGLDKVYASNVQVTMSNGDRLMPGTTVLGEVTSSFVLLEAGRMVTQEVDVGERAAVTKNPADRPVKLVVRAVRVKGVSYPNFTINLSCQAP